MKSTRTISTNGFSLAARLLSLAARRPAVLTALLAAVAAVQPASMTAAPPDKPQRANLVAIVTDDQALWAMGLYGNREIQTPHMDRIGREGALFTNAFAVTPVCSPSRASYLTGRWPTEVGITDYLAPEESDAGIGLDAITWPQILQQHGYTTGLVGKWHLGTQPQFHPHRLGFDHFTGFLGGGNKPMNPLLEVNGRDVQMQGSLPDLLVDDAIGFLRTNRGRPFALCLHFRAPHRPYGPVPEQDSAPYRNLDPTVPDFPAADIPQLKRSHLDYYASVSSIDRNLGRLLDELDALELSHNTLVIFTSDHGYNKGRHGIDTKGNGRWIAGGVVGPTRPNMWDTSVRVPLVARWPAVIKPGTRIEQMVSNLDMFRTVLGALEIEMPKGAVVHGVDRSPLLRGESTPDTEAVFGQYDLHNYGLAYLRMIRTPTHKLVRHFKERGGDELYDLRADPDESVNLLWRNRSPEVTALRKSLEDRLTAWQKSIDDPILKSPY